MVHTKQRGIFITFEGIDGSGKTVQALALKEQLEGLEIPVILTREPGGTAKIGESIRQVLLDNNNQGMRPMTELLLYNAARVQHIEDVIRPYLEKGFVVICDRFTDSTFAYQGFGRDMGLELIASLDMIATEGTKPDLTLLLRIDAATSTARTQKANKADRFDREKEEFKQRVIEGYTFLVAREPERMKVVDASGPQDEVKTKVWEIVSACLTSSGHIKKRMLLTGNASQDEMAKETITRMFDARKTILPRAEPTIA